MIDHHTLAEEIVDIMKASGHTLWIDPEVHSEQHKFIAEMILERRERAIRRKRIEDNIAGSIVLSTLLVVIGLLGAGVMEWLRKHL